jgi:EAL domain-containing protein (putative c-di-GMP-specific phosphodiesterase class I)/GGDEF domain-containing protein
VSSTPVFRDVRDQLGTMLREQGGLAVILIDMRHLARVERNYGGQAYQGLRVQIEPLLSDVRNQFRQGDVLARDEREGDRFLLFLGGRRHGDTKWAAEDIRKLCERVEDFLTPRVGRLTLPYSRGARPSVGVGYGFVLWTPLESEDRQLLRLIDEATESTDLRRRIRERDEREKLFEIIHNRTLWTAFQPIVEIDSRTVMGHEALSRGPRGTELETPYAMFTRAAKFGVTEELERACRRQAFQDWVSFGAPTRLFVNTVPTTVRDTSFLGRGVFDYLGPTLSPRFVTLEITEGQVIENLNLYREAMHAFLDLGFTFAIDDLGAGYSGLETVATLGASYLKIDMGLVRDVHLKKVNQQVIRAIVEMGTGVGATVIAEGIQTIEESDTCRELGVRYGQGYLFARPIDPFKIPLVKLTRE